MKVLKIALSLLSLGGALSLLGSPPAEAANAKPVIGVIELFGNPFFAEARKGMKSVADREGAELLIENANSDVGREAELVQTFIRRQVDVILISAQSATGSIAAIKLAKDAGIPVICWNTCIRSRRTSNLSRRSSPATTRKSARSPASRSPTM